LLADRRALSSPGSLVKSAIRRASSRVEAWSEFNARFAELSAKPFDKGASDQ